MSKSNTRQPNEIPIIGDVDDWAVDTIKSLLELPTQAACNFYIDSAGGSVYSALAVVNLIRMRKIRGTAYVLSECSSATLLVFAACRKRYVTPLSTFFFHRMRWQSEKRIGSTEAHQWAEHFHRMEQEIDALQAELFGAAPDEIRDWIQQGRYLSGTEIVDAGLAEFFSV